MTRHPKTAARWGSFRAPRRVAAPGPAGGPGASTPSRVVWLAQYAAFRLGWTPRRCVGCRDVRLIRGARAVCGQCRADPTTAAYATWLNTIRHWNRKRRR